MRRLLIARLLSFVREAAGHKNTGRWVGAIQRITGNSAGDAWCASFVIFCLEIAYRGKPPLPPTGSCQALLVYARLHNMLETVPEAGDVYLLLDDKGHAHHTGFVLNPTRNATHFEEISGNTNNDGSRDGYGVFVRTLDDERAVTARTLFIRRPKEPDA